MRTSPMDAPAVSGDLRQLDRALAVFQAERPRLFRIANRILGSVTETEDLMQDVWLRWQHTDRRQVGNSSAFLATVTSRAAINVVQSARIRHESATGSCLEDLVGVTADPTAGMERTEKIELVVRMLLERTSPAERAAYLLRRGFDYPYRQIAYVLHVGVANTRQLVRRAHVSIRTAGPRTADAHAHPRLVRAFSAAAHDGDFAELEAVLVADIRRGGRRHAGGRGHPTSLPAVETRCMGPAMSRGWARSAHG
jgi:RNA polymerase sigma-70 factor, ECF subfamily